VSADSPNGSPLSDIDFARLERKFGLLARQLTPADRQRLALPATLWPSIGSAAQESNHRDDAGNVRKLRSWPGWSGREALALAAGLLVVMFGGAALLTLGDGDAMLLAEAELGNDGLPVGFAGDGSVELRTTASRNQLEISLPSNLPQDEGSFFELWMIDPALEGMVSLGPIAVAGEAGDIQSIVVAVPESVDFERFPIVDVSVEAPDGDPTHSGQSILRGTLEPVDGT